MEQDWELTEEEDKEECNDVQCYVTPKVSIAHFIIDKRVQTRRLRTCENRQYLCVLDIL